ncbi:WYL domain-containing protein [Candidatus Poribacteria bacterium]|nr:WYL domain-containing protein [Candidatus Poribacteria bacterium]
MPQRIADEKQIERQWLILNKIARRNGVTKKQLIEETGASERTIERDLPILMRYFPSILKGKEGRQNRYRFKEDYQFPALDLSLLERLALTLAQDVTTFLKGTPYFEALTSAFAKMHATLPAEGQDYFNRIQNILAFRLQPVKDFQSVTPHINQAQIACAKRQRLDLLYHSASRGESLQRKVDPYGIAYSDNALRLIGYCHTRQAVREFVFDDRMRSLTILNETFESQESFNLNEYIARGFGGIKDQPVQAVIRISPPASRWVRSQKWPGLQKQIDRGNDQIELHFDTEGREGLMRQILQWGSCAEVVTPPDFREEITQEIEKMTKKYQKL